MLTPEKLAEIKQVIEGLRLSGHLEAERSAAALAFNFIPDLIAEIERLQADNLALAEAVNGVVNDGRVVEILERYAPEALRKLGDALFTD